MQVQSDPQLHQQLLGQWWKQYNAAIRGPNRADDYPHLVDAYLTAMLANRLSLQPEPWPRGLLAEKLPAMDQTLGLILGTESARVAIERDTMLHTPEQQAGEPLQPLPRPVAIEAVAWPAPSDMKNGTGTSPPKPAGGATAGPLGASPLFHGEVQIEPLAMHVPEEWFYVRFAGFPNYQWFRTTLDTWSGDLRNLISLRGVDYGLNARTQRQLSLRESALSQLLGPTVIADMALVGDDTFLREGAAIGTLFQARSNLLLANDISNNRAQTLAENPDAKETHLTIAGHDVSFLSTPDNRVRSFYAVDGDFHLVTTSRKMVERFYEAGAGKRPLGNAADFRHARSIRKPTDNDAIFAYLSQAFFQQLASPHYQIEMTRRSALGHRYRIGANGAAGGKGRTEAGRFDRAAHSWQFFTGGLFVAGEAARRQPLGFASRWPGDRFAARRARHVCAGAGCRRDASECQRSRRLRAICSIDCRRRGGADRSDACRYPAHGTSRTGARTGDARRADDAARE